MEDLMKKLTQATMNLGRWTKILNYWTIIVIIILIPLILWHFFDPVLFPFSFSILYIPIYLLFLLFLFLAVLFIKETQQKIILTIIRGFIGFIIPFAVLGLNFWILNLWLIVLLTLFGIVGLLICTFIFFQVLALNTLTKKVLKATKSQ